MEHDYRLGEAPIYTLAEQVVANAARANQLDAFQPADEEEREALIAELRRENRIWRERARKVLTAAAESAYSPIYDAYNASYSNGHYEHLGETPGEVVGTLSSVIGGWMDTPQDPEDDGWDEGDFTQTPPIRSIR